ncbi:MAG: hypothetical protein HLUCCA08_10915 [Rhodobacteraceae bacterium HLUCCA08]|nr:MAG: hypothetical protein HLUCCA08_10915 [Rhodobacteraceae bacterium HLUCCA08]
MRNLSTRLPRRRRAVDPMRAFDRLPAPLRRWAARAALPWSARSLQRAWHKALVQADGCERRAMETMTRLEEHALEQDGPRIWGAGYPRISPAATR